MAVAVFYDIAMKARLLRSLIRVHLPDEKHPLKGPRDLSHVVSMLKSHQLLSEYVIGVESIDPKVVQSWKASVDVWVDRVLLLVSSNMPDKCWAGVCLLGVTSQECSSERFLASFSLWLQKLQSHIQPPADSHFVKVASCASLSDLFTRMSRFPRLKKDATSHAVKLTQPLLKLLNEDSSEVVWEVAVCLLCTFITFFPSSIHRCYDTVETAVVSKIMSGKSSLKMMKELGHCLVLLPKSKGDEESWSLMMQKILLRINVHLNDAFQGVEEESKGNEIMKLLVPPGKDPPPPLGCQIIVEAPDQRTKRSHQLQISSVSTLLSCSCSMLTSSYPVRVRVPIRPLIALAGRVLMVDGSLSEASFPFTTAMQQESICSELPALHMHSLELLSATIKTARSQLLPHAAEIVGLVTEYFKRCLLPDLRVKVYSIIRILLMSMGVGVTVYLTQEVIKNAFVDLDTIANEGSRTSSSVRSNPSSEILFRPCHKKRKHSSTAVSLEEQPDLNVGEAVNPIPVQVMIAALETLEALVTVGGALGAESWRPSIDSLVITVATNGCKAGWAKEEDHIFVLSEPVPSWADFQLASLRALLASLLSPARFRSQHLARGLELFRRGRQEIGTKIGDFCAHALLALEVVIHPRALSLIDFSSPIDTSFDVAQPNAPFSNGIMGKGTPNYSNSVHDDLYESWFGNDDEMEIPLTETEKDGNYIEKQSVSEENGPELASVCDDARISETKRDENTQLQEPDKVDWRVPSVVGACQVISLSVSAEGDTTSHSALAATVTSSLERRRDPAIDLDSASESIPDIVDGDPDSD